MIKFCLLNRNLTPQNKNNTKKKQQHELGLNPQPSVSEEKKHYFKIKYTLKPTIKILPKIREITNKTRLNYTSVVRL